MDDFYDLKKEELLKDPNFIYEMKCSCQSTDSYIRKRISSIDVLTKIGLPCIIIGFFAVCGKITDRAFLRLIAFCISIAAMVISYVSYQNAIDKLSDYVFSYDIFPAIIKKKLSYDKEKRQEEIISDLDHTVSQSIEIFESIRYRKTIPKESWDELYRLLIHSAKLHRQYSNLSIRYDCAKNKISEDYLFMSDIKEKW